MVTDAAVTLWVYVWVRIGMFVHDLVARLSAAGETMENAGRRFASVVSGAGEEVVDVPLVGEQLRRPFDTVEAAGRTLQDAGRFQQDAVLTLALWLGILLAVVPIIVVLQRWLPGRASWIREAGAAARVRAEVGGSYLFALRAAAVRPLHEVRRADPDPGGSLAAGSYGRLAEFELRSMGLRPPESERT